MRLPSPLALLLVAAGLIGCAPRLQTAAWVVRYDLDTPAKVEEVCTAAKTARFDALLLQVRGRADAYYRSAIAPPGESLAKAPADFDPLGAALAACGPIPIHAWLNVYYLWSGEPRPTDPRHPASPGHDWIIGDANGRKVSGYSELDRALGGIEGLYADPASESYRQLMAQVVRELVERYPIQGIHLDFIRYPGAAYGQTGPLGQRFEREWGIDPRLLPVEVTRESIDRWLGNAMTPGESVLTTAALFWADLRAQQVTAMVRGIRNAIKEAGRPGVTLSAAVFPDSDDAYLARGQDWQSWASEGLVDGLYPMTYFGPAARVEGQLRAIAQQRGEGVRYWAGLGAYIKGPEQIAAEANAAEALGYDGVAFFSLGHLLKNPAGVAPYAAALHDRAPLPPAPAHTPPAAAPLEAATSDDLATLRRIVIRATGGATRLPLPQLDRILRTKLDELTAAREHGFAAALARLRQQAVTPPPWVELHGIFRYIHPLDPPETRQRQESEAITLRERLLQGEDFETLARKFSQGGSRALGGPLGRRSLDLDRPADAALAQLAPGTISPVLSGENGYWLYRLDTKGQDAPADWDTLPWPDRRICFRHVLDALLREITPPPAPTKNVIE